MYSSLNAVAVRRMVVRGICAFAAIYQRKSVESPYSSKHRLPYFERVWIPIPSWRTPPKPIHVMFMDWT